MATWLSNLFSNKAAAAHAASAVETTAAERPDIVNAVGWGAAAFNAFLPLNPMFVIPQFGLFVVFLLIYIFAAGAGWWSLPLAWITQGVIMMLLIKLQINLVLKFIPGLG